MVRKETAEEKRKREAKLRSGKPAKGSLNLADRQELADARSRNAGIEPRLLETGSSFSSRVPRELELRGAQEEGERQKAGAIAAITAGNEAVAQEVPEAEVPKEEKEPAPSLASLGGISNLLSGKDISVGGKTISTGLRGQDVEVLGGSLPLGINPALAAEAAPTLASSTSNFLTNAFSKGKVASSTKGVLSAPSKAQKGASALKVSAGSILAFSGLGSLKNVTSKLLTSKAARIEAEVTKLGEQLTKVPEAASLGFSLDEEGNLFEYTPTMALEEIEIIEQSLIEAEDSLQAATIGSAVLKLSNKYKTAQAEIDKQRREITVARGKILRDIANPSESLLNSRDFFRGLDLIE